MEQAKGRGWDLRSAVIKGSNVSGEPITKDNADEHITQLFDALATGFKRRPIAPNENGEYVMHYPNGAKCWVGMDSAVGGDNTVTVIASIGVNGKTEYVPVKQNNNGI